MPKTARSSSACDRRCKPEIEQNPLVSYLMGMIKTILAILAGAVLVASTSFAGAKGCCSKDMQQTANNSGSCMNLASLNLTQDQNTKLMTWQKECMKDGCTKESRAAFMKKAKSILSADQYAQLKSECDKTMTKRS
jgi:hypothetical protein